MYEITSNIPVPKRSKYPFDEMNPGDSFAVPVPSKEDGGAFANAIRTRCYAWGKKNKAQLKAYLSKDKTEVRVWLVSKAA